MNVNELLDQAKKALNVDSDYALAKAMEIDRGDIAHYRKGKMIPNVYAATRLAVVLDRDPIQLIAEIEAATEKNEKKRGFWQRFLSHSRTAAFCLAVALNCSAGWLAAGASAPFGRRRYFA